MTRPRLLPAAIGGDLGGVYPVRTLADVREMMSRPVPKDARMNAWRIDATGNRVRMTRDEVRLSLRGVLRQRRGRAPSQAASLRNAVRLAAETRSAGKDRRDARFLLMARKYGKRPGKRQKPPIL